MNYCSILKNGHSITGILASMLEKTEKFTLLFGVVFWLCSGFMFLAILLWKATKITGLPSKVENHLEYSLPSSKYGISVGSYHLKQNT